VQRENQSERETPFLINRCILLLLALAFGDPVSVWVLRGKGSDLFLRVLCRLGFHAISSSENQLGIFLTEIPSIHPDVKQEVGIQD